MHKAQVPVSVGQLLQVLCDGDLMERDGKKHIKMYKFLAMCSYANNYRSSGVDGLDL